MNRLNHRKFAGTYFKQGALSVLLLLMTLCLAYTSSLAQALFPPEISSLSTLASGRYVSRHPIVKINCSSLSYTGYDNHSGKKVTGHYYYTIEDGYLLYILLDASEDKPADTLENYACTVRLIEDQTLHNELNAHFSETMDWSSDSLKEMTLPIVASQPDCHLSSTILFTIALLAGIFVFSLSAALNFYHYYKCRKHAKTRRHEKHPV